MKETAVTQEFPEEYVEQVRAAEAAAQRSVIYLPDGDTPADLAKSLDLRVEVNLAQADGRTVTRVGGADAQVRELEAPYSRRRAAEPAETAPQTRGSHRRRATKKAPAKNKENS
jgi:hypothetical protein